MLDLVPVVGEIVEADGERDIIIPEVRRGDVHADDTVIGALHLRFDGSSDERAMNACLYPFAEALVGRLELPSSSAAAETGSDDAVAAPETEVLAEEEAPVEEETPAGEEVAAEEETPDSGSESEGEGGLQLAARYRVELLDIIAEIAALDAPPHFYRYGRARFDRTGRRALFPLLLTSSRNSSVAQVVCEFTDEQWQVLGFAIDINELQSTPTEERPLFNPLARDGTSSGG